MVEAAVLHHLEVRVIAVQHPVDPPLENPVRVRAGGVLHIDLDAMPLAERDHDRGHVGLVAPARIRPAAGHEIVHRPDPPRARTQVEVQQVGRPARRPDERNLVDPRRITFKGIRRLPPKAPVQLRSPRWEAELEHRGIEAGGEADGIQKLKHRGRRNGSRAVRGAHPPGAGVPPHPPSACPERIPTIRGRHRRREAEVAEEREARRLVGPDAVRTLLRRYSRCAGHRRVGKRR